MAASGQVRGEVAAGTEQALLGLFLLIRLAVLAQMVWSLALTWERYSAPLLALATVVAVIVESGAVAVVGIRRRMIDSRLLMLVDLSTATAATIAGALLLTGSADPVTDNVFYPYAVTAISITGLVVRSLPGILVIPLVAAAAYVGVTGALFGPDPGLFVNAFTYWTYAVIGWVLTRALRHLSRSLDEARAMAAARECELAAERERLRMSRDLHDRVLQTLEFLGREVWISDAQVRNRVAEEAMWLRRRIEDACGHQESGDVTAILEAVVGRQVLAGLRVELNTARMAGVRVSDPVGEALAGAVTEALTNVRKHSGTAAAILRAVPTENQVVVTVVDQGRGFDPAATRRGFGLRQSIIGRVEQAGGVAQVTSSAGEGTHVELWIPRADSSSAPARLANGA